MKISKKFFLSSIILILIVSTSLSIYLYLEREKQLNISFSEIERELDNIVSSSRGSTINTTYLYNYPPFKLKPSRNLSRYEVESIVRNYLLNHSIYNFTILGISASQHPLRPETIYTIIVKTNDSGKIEFKIHDSGIIIFIMRYNVSWRVCHIDEKAFNDTYNDTYLVEFLRRELIAMGFPLTDEYGIEIEKSFDPGDIWTGSQITIFYYITYKGYRILHENKVVLKFLGDCSNLVIDVFNTPPIEIFQLIDEGRVRIDKNIDEDRVKEVINKSLSEIYGVVYYMNISYNLGLLPIDVDCDFIYDVLELCYHIDGYIITESGLVYLGIEFPYTYISAVTGELLSGQTLVDPITCLSKIRLVGG